MSEISVTRNKQVQVFEACDNIHARGENVTNESIMQELLQLGYKKGSNSDITRYKHEWRQQNADRLKQSLPSRPDKLTSVIDEIRAEAYREANIEIEKIKSDYEAEREKFLETINCSDHEISRLRKSLEEYTVENEELKHRVQTLTKGLEGLTHTHHIEKAAHELTKSQSAERKIAFEQQIESLQKINQQILELQQKQLESHKSELSEIIERSESQRHQYIVEIDGLKTKISSLEKALLKKEHENKFFSELKDRLNNEVSMLMKNIESKEVFISELKETNHTHTKSFENYFSKLPDLFKECKKIETNYSLINTMIHKLEENIFLKLEKFLHDRK
jgi:chromosome segregation ATPase